MTAPWPDPNDLDPYASDPCDLIPWTPDDTRRADYDGEVDAS